MLGWFQKRRIVGFERFGVFKRFQLTLPIFMLGRIARWFFLRYLVSYGGAKLYLLLYLLLGGCWRISLLLGSIWKDEGCWLKILCVVCVGRRKNFSAICFFYCSFVWRVWCFCFKWLGVSLFLTLILCQTLLN